nr:cysteine-rich protein 2 [Pelodiscus sinensis]|eukprot:XP_025034306.1 cysteine-rich protein 2 [Pelodiscus sinensis]
MDSGGGGSDCSVQKENPSSSLLDRRRTKNVLPRRLPCCLGLALGAVCRAGRARVVAEKVTSLGKDWHKFCLKCERCNKTLTPGGHAEVRAGRGRGRGTRGLSGLLQTEGRAKGLAQRLSGNTGARCVPIAAPKGASRLLSPATSSVTTFTGEPNMCPRCGKRVYFGKKAPSLGKDWHRPCLKCEKCNKTLSSGGHAEHDGKPYCNQPCYAALFGPKGFGRGGTESHSFK